MRSCSRADRPWRGGDDEAGWTGLGVLAGSTCQQAAFGPVMKRRRLPARDGDVLRPSKRRLVKDSDLDDVLPLVAQAGDATSDLAEQHGVESRDEGTGRLRKRAAQPLTWDQGRQYGIVVDAGSSGSRIQVYSWRKHDLSVLERKTDGKKLDVLPRVETGVEEGDGWHLKVEPGPSTTRRAGVV